MDGKLCLWSERNRSQCIDLHRDSIHPISKVVSDMRYNIAMSCSYDGSIAVWNFSDSSSEIAESKSSGGSLSSAKTCGLRTAAPRSHGSLMRQHAGPNQSNSPLPAGYLAAHTEPVLECAYRGDTFVSGDKSGSMIIWDLRRCQPLHKFRAHPGAITAVDCMEDRCTVITTGTDGFVKVWDPRTPGSGLVAKIGAHAGVSGGPGPGGGSGSGSGSGRPVGGPGSAGRGVSGRTTGVPVRRLGRSAAAGSGMGARIVSMDGRGTTIERVSGSGSAGPSSRGGGGSGGPAAGAISCMAVTESKGSCSDACYIVTGGGSAADSSIALLDMRRGAAPVSRWNHHRNGVYSLCVVGEQCVLSGDGEGTLLCHQLLASEFDYPQNCLKYGIGASSQGAVRTIDCINGKVVTSGEDGNVLVFDYDPSMFT
jgi:hypothetical protein